MTLNRKVLMAASLGALMMIAASPASAGCQAASVLGMAQAETEAQAHSAAVASWQTLAARAGGQWSDWDNAVRKAVACQPQLNRDKDVLGWSCGAQAIACDKPGEQPPTTITQIRDGGGGGEGGGGGR
jgi:hypothetical protein